MTNKSNIIIGLLLVSILLSIIFGAVLIDKNDTIIKNAEKNAESNTLMTSTRSTTTPAENFYLDQRVIDLEKFLTQEENLLEDRRVILDKELDDLRDIKVLNQSVFEQINEVRVRLGRKEIDRDWGIDLDNYDELPLLPAESRYFSPSITRDNLKYDPRDFEEFKVIAPRVKIDRSNVDEYLRTVRIKALRTTDIADNVRIRIKRTAVRSYNNRRRNCRLNLRLNRLRSMLGEEVPTDNLGQCSPIEKQVYFEKSGYDANNLSANGFTSQEIDGMFP